MLELGVTNGVILPSMKMTGAEERCAFLDEGGRCSIHAWRPGVCRLFPLGRFYENGDFKYFLQVGECQEKKRAKVKVSKWIDTPNQARNHTFICQWHSVISGRGRFGGGKAPEYIAATDLLYASLRNRPGLLRTIRGAVNPVAGGFGTGDRSVIEKARFRLRAHEISDRKLNSGKGIFLRGFGTGIRKENLT